MSASQSALARSASNVLDLGPRDDPSLGDRERLALLSEENRRLKRINQALMGRVERSLDHQGNAYALFQTAIVLEDKARSRTRELEDALHQLERSNDALGRAKQEAEHARAHLSAAIEAISEGFALYDDRDRLVLYNRKFADLFETFGAKVSSGAHFLETVRRALEAGAIAGQGLDSETWLNERLARHRDPGEPFPLALADGRWIQVSERPTLDGGVVGLYTDITEIKASEARRRERELAQKSLLLQSTLDSLAQGVSVFDSEFRLVAWNDRFRELLALPRELVHAGVRFVELIDYEATRHGISADAFQAMIAQWAAETGMRETLQFEYSLGDGRIVEVRRNGMPDGGFVSTYTDVTGERHAARAVADAKTELERRVAERTAELTGVNAKLVAEIEERRAVEEALREATAEAERANLGKTRFLAAASHDLLQPLNAARLFLAALSELEATSGQRRLIDNTGEAMASVDDLLNALLDISRLDAGAIQPEISDFAIASLLRSLARDFSPLAAEKGLELRYVPSRVTIRSDPHQLRQILQNFLSNAIRYTNEGRVLLGARRRGDSLKIEVWDTGPGIPPDRHEEIFEEFRRLGNSHGGRDNGLGLGLSIVQRTARMLSHPVEVRSRPDWGSVFAVSVPLSQNSPAPRPNVVSPRPPKFGLTGFFVVVVENDQTMAHALASLLEGWSCQVLETCSGEEALQNLEVLAIRPDLVIADYHLDDGDCGTQAVAALRARYGKDVPAILITADRSAEVADTIREAGFDPLHKPVKPAELRSLMSHLLS